MEALSRAVLSYVTYRANAPLSPYELDRLRNIDDNKKVLQSLGLEPLTPQPVGPPPKKSTPKAPVSQPVRRSKRDRAVPAVDRIGVLEEGAIAKRRVGGRKRVQTSMFGDFVTDWNEEESGDDGRANSEPPRGPPDANTLQLIESVSRESIEAQTSTFLQERDKFLRRLQENGFSAHESVQNAADLVNQFEHVLKMATAAIQNALSLPESSTAAIQNASSLPESSTAAIQNASSLPQSSTAAIQNASSLPESSSSDGCSESARFGKLTYDSIDADVRAKLIRYIGIKGDFPRNNNGKYKYVSRIVEHKRKKSWYYRATFGQGDFGTFCDERLAALVANLGKKLLQENPNITREMVWNEVGIASVAGKAVARPAAPNEAVVARPAAPNEAVDPRPAAPNEAVVARPDAPDDAPVRLPLPDELPDDLQPLPQQVSEYDEVLDDFRLSSQDLAFFD